MSDTVKAASQKASQPAFRKASLIQWLLVVMLAAIVTISLVPSYLSGQQPWRSELTVPHLEQLRALMDEALPLSGWQSTYHQAVQISGNGWSLNEYQPTLPDAQADSPKVAILLRPQTSPDKQPEVEWIDIAGSQGWQVSDVHRVDFAMLDADGHSRKITTRYFRSIADRNTYAVMQWYAWPTGGHPAPSKWFWSDQIRQWRQRERMPWVAVSILMPIEPVGNIRPHTDRIVAIAESVQASLQSVVFQDSKGIEQP